MQYKQAKEIAIRVLRELEKFTTKCDIVGSVSREKPEPHDLELTCLPRTIEVTDLFGEVQERKRIHEFCVTVKRLGVILKGDVEKGRYVQIQLPENINLDLFIPQESDYERQKNIRIGPSEYSHKVLAAGWLKKGFAGTKEGLRLQSECYKKDVGGGKHEWVCNVKNPTLPPVWQNSWEFFQWLGIEFKEPKYRTV